MQAKRVGDLLAASNQGNVLARGQALLALQAGLDKLLPKSFRGQVFVADLKDGLLSLACAHGALATRLRNEAPRLAESLSQQGLAVQQLKILVRPDLPLYRGPVKPKPELSQAALNALIEVEKTLEPGGLQNAVQRMIRRHKP
ncbi:MAG TPA: DciA family protein [Thiobacillaceae bacterium]|nr:DciA family protein [Thiobacillaceae bacterium]